MHQGLGKDHHSDVGGEFVLVVVFQHFPQERRHIDEGVVVSGSELRESLHTPGGEVHSVGVLGTERGRENLKERKERETRKKWGREKKANENEKEKRGRTTNK
jgi:hypothetical protein